MTRWTFKFAVFALVLGFASTSLAQDGESQETTYDFDGDTVEGALLRPEGDLMSGTRHGKESSLINIRADFIPEMVRSVHEL